MRAAVWTKPLTIEMKEVERPRPGAGQVLVRTKSVGICGTDVHIWRGEFAPAKPPLILGHEAAGIVEEVGEGVENVKPGDKVVVDPALYCGKCEYCRRGAYYQCDHRGAIGMDTDGAYAEFFVAPALNCYPLPEGMGWEEAAFVDTLACPINAMNLMPHRWGETVAILGDGPAGLCFLQLCRLSGASLVIVTGTEENRLRLAREYGADLTVNVHQQDPVEAIMEATQGRGVDTTIEACGAPEAVRQAIKVTRKQGKIMIYGVFAEPVDGVDFQDMHRREITIYGSSGAPWSYPAAISLIATGRVRVREMITHTFTLEQLDEALRTAAERRDGYIKGVVLI